MQSNKIKGIIIYIVIIALLVCGLIAILNSIAPYSSDSKVMAWNKTYSELLDEYDKKTVKWFELDLGSGQLDFRTKDLGDDSKYRYAVPNVSVFLSDIDGYREAYNKDNPSQKLEFDYHPIKDNSFLISFIPYLILIALMIGFTFIIMRQTTGGGKMSQFSRANTRNQPANGKKVTFADGRDR